MTAPFGYHGHYLRIDLTTRRTETVPLSAVVLRDFIGGSGLGTRLVLSEGADHQNPLAPEAPLAFVFSPFVGSPLTTSAKFTVISKSPLTERINDSLCSSHFAIAGKSTGYDALVIVGAAERPTCVVIEPEGVRFEDASEAWGRPAAEAADRLRASIGPHHQMAVIGPAGENLVHFATISHEGRHAGRGGAGAVMGAKNLKAVAVQGGRMTRYAQPQQLLQYSNELSQASLGPATARYRELGTVSNLLILNRLGALPTRNFQSGEFEQADAISPEAISQTRKRTKKSCASCTIGCEHIFHRRDTIGDPAVARGVRMEFESLYALGPLCGISDPDVVLEACAYCDESGMDTISAGAAVAFAMECAERGLLAEPELRFGNGQALLHALQSIAARTGVGEILSRGTRSAAREIGHGAEDFAPHVKGLELPGYEPRALQTTALGLSVNARGADHNRSGAHQVDFSERVDRLNVGLEGVPLAIATENEAAVMDSLILCKFLRGVFDDKMAAMAKMLRLVTGWDVTAEELERTANRIVTAKKWYNIRQGWTPAEDTLPRRFFQQPLRHGPSRGAVLSEAKLGEMVRAYNTARGWTPEGYIPQDLLQALRILAPGG